MKATVAGWFGFEDGHATAGDLLARIWPVNGLSAGPNYNVALAPPFRGGLDWVAQRIPRVIRTSCAVLSNAELESDFLEKFAGSGSSALICRWRGRWMRGIPSTS